ncbi:MAG: phage tail tape measure C-terminal domain-containing protein [Pseudomonadota bacterium]
MTDPVRIDIDATGLSEGLREAGAEVDEIVRSQLTPAAEAIEDAFSKASRSIESELTKAARSGSLSFRDLGRAITADLANIAVDSLVRAPIEGLVSSAVGAVFGGARAGGGPVAPGVSYLVGERGPEVFTPSVSGSVGGGAARNVVVNLSMPGRAVGGVQRSEAQIAASLARAARKGLRNL